MSAVAGARRRRGRRRWSQLSSVEHVGLYTRQSLYFVLVATNLMVLLSAGDRLGEPAAALPLLAGVAVLTLAGCRTLQVLLGDTPVAGGPTLRAVAPVTALALLLVLVAALIGPDGARSQVVLIASITVSLCVGILPSDRAALGVIAGSALLGAVHEFDPPRVFTAALVASAFVATGRASMWLFGIVRELDQARATQSELAVMEERLRFSRDVHDVMGRRLSTIAVQAELAATLAARGDARAPERMLEVREIAHQALREARELARGYRSTDLDQELDGARSLLRSAGIEVQLHVEAMPRAWHEPAGWVVREAVTNVLRHSRASRVEIAIGSGQLRIDNDGAPSGGAGHGDGAGLQGLRERLDPLGASLLAGPRGADGWSVVAELPGAGPLSASAAGETEA